MSIAPIPIIPAHATLSSSARQILAFLREVGGRATPLQLQERFRALANSEGSGAPSWVSARMQQLRQIGHVGRSMDEHGNVRSWYLATVNPLDEDEALPANVATPRRVSMFGPVYTPPPSNHRAGSMDYARLPSIINGRPQPFRGRE